ncbi:DNA-binding SARP family transcriptional activator [Streptomyces sp. BK208]|uniref:AfsR/SARP family transcriptional regulator n=1 Tax=Streptomyces sp. BK208 TaxID=2512150 RepID=UPI00105C706E|nr:AfsR/SARP family transcriptional regulator [Streptomyces sp. BK208]TDT40760.1 DNA-binding SARP family transcriptional activator [Streptomyces sp. BK208]
MHFTRATLRTADRERARPALALRILGPLEAVGTGGLTHRPRGPKVGKLLALLAVRAHDIVEVDTLVEELWDTAPPPTAVSTVRTHVYHLRQELDRALGPDIARGVIATEATGYSLRTAPGMLDLENFTRLYGQGRAELRAGHRERALERLDAALGLWRGRTLADVAQGRVLAGHAARIEELRVRAQELRIEAAMGLGLHRELVPELRSLVAVDPLNEWLHARLIDALHRCGRRGDALRAFYDVRAVLAEELGLEPSADLRRLQHDILAGGPAA